MSRKLDQNSAVQRLEDALGDIYDYSQVVYKDSHSKITLVCKEHGPFEVSYTNAASGRGCKICGYHRIAKARTLSNEVALEKLKSVHGNSVGYSKFTYYGNTENITLCCERHGDFEITYDNASQGRGCQKCSTERSSRSRRISLEQAKTNIKSVHGDTYDLSNVAYTGRTHKVTLVCKYHGAFTTRYSTLMQGSGCPSCGNESIGDSLRLSEQQVIDNIKIVHGDKYVVDTSEYKGAFVPLHLICKEHGSFTKTYDNLVNGGNGCPRCVANKSKGELELYDFIKSLSADAILGDRKQLSGKEMDIFVPSKKLAFEFNGLYYHSTRFDKDTNKHHTKSHRATELGIRLIHIYEDDWSFRREIVEKLIRTAMGCSTLKKYNARELAVMRKPSREVCEFFDTNHIQGTSSGEAWCLCEGETILAAMQVSILRSERGNTDRSVYELTRYATSENVRGGASKLFKAFVREVKPSSVVSYSSNDMFTGLMYETLGFKKKHITPPDYKYVVRNKRIHKTNFKKAEIAKKFPHIYNLDRTEFEMMEELNIHRIYDCGLTKWVYETLGVDNAEKV